MVPGAPFWAHHFLQMVNTELIFLVSLPAVLKENGGLWRAYPKSWGGQINFQLTVFFLRLAVILKIQPGYVKEGSERIFDFQFSFFCIRTANIWQCTDIIKVMLQSETKGKTTLNSKCCILCITVCWWWHIKLVLKLKIIACLYFLYVFFFTVTFRPLHDCLDIYLQFR